MMIMHENLVFLKHDDDIFYATVCAKFYSFFILRLGCDSSTNKDTLDTSYDIRGQDTVFFFEQSRI